MAVLQSSMAWVLDQFHQRLGDPYVYGGVYSSTDTSQGCDCSGLVGWVLEALVNTPDNMSWAHNVSTESWPYDYSTSTPAAPGTVGPYGTIAIASPTDQPADSALLISIMHGGGGEDSHTACYTGPAITPTSLSDPAGEIMESNGDAGTCTNGTGGTGVDSDIWTDWWYLPGPIINPENIVTLYYPDVSNNNWTSNQDLFNFLAQLHPQGFAGVVHKVSEGNYYTDPYWQPCRTWCEHNGLSWLGYHYVTTNDPASQVSLWNSNNGGPNVMLDFEANSGDINNFWAVVQAFNDANINVSLAYIPRWYWSQIGQPDLSSLAANQIQLVSSNYPGGGGYASDIYEHSGGNGGPGWAPYGGATPTCWQFTPQASIAGHIVDCNAYNGPGPNLDALFTS